MTTKHNLRSKIARLQRDFYAINKRISAIAAKPTPMSAPDRRFMSYALRNLRRTYDDLRATEKKLRAMP
jgi:hypothetical protein